MGKIKLTTETASYKRKAIFLDRDGTINVEKNYLYKKEKFEFLEGSLDAMRQLYDSGFLLFVVTNQSGIARGFYTEDDFMELNRWMLEEMEKHGVKIAGVSYCPHHPDAKVERYRKNCECRKPATGLFRDIINEFGIDTSRSFAVGDKERDLSICMESDVRGFLLYSHEEETVGNIRKIRGGLYEAAGIILGRNK